MAAPWIQLITATVGSLGFSFLFHLRGRRLVAATLGGFLAWGLFLLFSLWLDSEILCYLIVSTLISLYAETAARVLKTPAGALAITSLIPLVPGGSLYYTMAYVFDRGSQQFLSKAISTLGLTCALALGIVLSTALSRVIFRKKEK